MQHRLPEYIESLKRFEVDRKTLSVEIPAMYIFPIIGALQLALRHPNLPYETKAMILEFIKRAGNQLSDFPVLQEMIELGFDPNHDGDL